MGNLISSSNTSCVELEDGKMDLLNNLAEHINLSSVKIINEPTSFGRVSQNYRPESTQEMKKFYNQTIQSMKNIAQITVIENDFKGVPTKVNVRIMEIAPQDEMLRGIREVPGRAISLIYCSKQPYDPSCFSQKHNWSGYWYDGKLVGRIEF